MKFTDWIKEECGMTWEQLKETPTTQDQFYRLYEDYEQYCKDNGFLIVWDFGKNKGGA